MKNVTVAKFELAFTRCRNNLKTVRNLSVKSSLQDFDAKEVYLNPKNYSVSFQKRLKMLYFHHFKVFTRCRFQNVPIRAPFSKSAVFKICRQKMCRFRVNRRPIRRIFHRFQNVPASCERSLSRLTWYLEEDYSLINNAFWWIFYTFQPLSYNCAQFQAYVFSSNYLFFFFGLMFTLPYQVCFVLV